MWHFEIKNGGKQRRPLLIRATSWRAWRFDVAKCESRSKTDSSNKVFFEAMMELKPFSDAKRYFWVDKHNVPATHITTHPNFLLLCLHRHTDTRLQWYSSDKLERRGQRTHIYSACTYSTYPIIMSQGAKKRNTFWNNVKVSECAKYTLLMFCHSMCDYC